MPLHMVIAKPQKIQPRLAIGQPFQPATMPAIPESVTAVGDQTGKPYFKMGDNPAGPETVQVTPPRAPVSMASGGIVTIGNAILRTPLPGEDPLVGQANFLQSQDASKYGALGVPQPTAVSPGSGSLFAGQTPALQSSADETLNNFRLKAANDALQARVYGERNQYDRIAAANAAPARVSRASTAEPPTPLEMQLEARKIEDQTQRLAGKVPYQDPETGKVTYMTPAQAAIKKYKYEQAFKQQLTGVGPGQELYTDPWTGVQKVLSKAESDVQQAKDSARISSAASGQYVNPETGEVTQLTPAQAAIARAQEAKRIATAVSGVPEGMEKYTDPFTGAQKVMTPHDVQLQKLKDTAAIKKEYEATLGPLSTLSETQILNELVNTGPDSPQAEVFKQELRSRGASEDAINILIRQASEKGGNAAAIAKAFAALGGP